MSSYNFMKKHIEAYISLGLSSVLHSQRIIMLARAALRPFPNTEETIRILNYKLKRLFMKPATPLTQHELEQQKNMVAISSRIPYILFDVSGISIRDLGSGIQRVVRSILLETIKNSVKGYRILPVRITADGQMLQANLFVSHLIGEEVNITDNTIEISPGDIFFCTDLHLPLTFYTLQPLRKKGLRVIFTIYDIFAIKLDVFPKAFAMAFGDWFNGVLTTADAIICDSRSVADEVHDWLRQHPEARQSPLPIGYFHLGADLESSKPTEGASQDEASMLAVLREQPTLLMVGTVELRKGHAPALDALETLWAEGTDINLVIVGKEGWRSHDLVRRLRRHPRRNKQLFWLEKASDALLMQLYAQSTALLAASFAEGFGLPLIEAAHYGLPVIARDIPVFHEVAGDFAFYFPNSDSAALADSLRHWLQLHAEGQAPRSAGMPYLTWAQSTQQLLRVILENRWYTTYQPAEARVAPDPE